MREIRKSGSEGGGAEFNRPSLPLSAIDLGNSDHRLMNRINQQTAIGHPANGVDRLSHLQGSVDYRWRRQTVIGQRERNASDSVWWIRHESKKRLSDFRRWTRSEFGHLFHR